MELPAFEYGTFSNKQLNYVTMLLDRARNSDRLYRFKIKIRFGEVLLLILEVMGGIYGTVLFVF